MNTRLPVIRTLTAAETAAAQTVFADSLDYAAVRIRSGFPVLPLSAACAPRGRIYFPQRHCSADFACGSDAQILWLIHELTHVWQWQNGYKPWLGGLILAVQGGYFRRAAYRIPPDAPSLPFAALNMEQQAVAVEQLYIVKNLPHIILPPERTFQTALNEFADNPNNPALLPRYFCRLPA
ncbi:MAG: type IV secretion protein Rhs [Neisseria sp.]|nr:type IV secretion protein Rhs [Neisseria sp.]